MKMVRKQVYITQDQDERLKRLAEEKGVTEAEVIRAALDGLIEVTHEAAAGAANRRVAEAAVMEYAVEQDTDIGARAREELRRRLARKAWEEELAFIRSLADRKPADETGPAWKFNREEVYEERLDKILRRH